MKLTATIQVTVDGVMQANGGAHPDLDPGYDRGGWALPLFDDESFAHVEETYERADAFLFGRRTYDFFAHTWGAIPDMMDSRIGRALNEKPKYVASTTLTRPHWAPGTVLPGGGDGGDLAAAAQELKAAPGGELQVHGSGDLTRWLLAQNLLDELHLLTVPVIVGRGIRLFPHDGPDHALDLTEFRAFPKGITLQTYRLARRPQYAAH
ncbi:dihydrofolate reductase family protein [Jiangella mangrovi]|uniref:Dihydrofolate reductase n=1 Tax=Jiangella mangrovi TaxID=1524084 RepID=A0A7W9GQL2_9ACTN|nr:dihydrofolate reductase family protein [Jiangella mangrovi]MBB5788034.1 dihydrofolate reductase [Jiangella mangrovi]